MTEYAEKARAIFFSFIMVTSVVAGSMAFAGSAAAAGTNDSSAPTIESIEADIVAGTDTIYVVFDEPVYASSGQSGALSKSDFTYTDGDSSADGDASSISSVSHTAGERVLKITTDNTLTSDDISGATGADSIDIDSVHDGSGNSQAISGQNINNNAVSIVDVEAEPNTNTATLIFSEGVGQEGAQTTGLTSTELSASGFTNSQSLADADISHSAGTESLSGMTATITLDDNGGVVAGDIGSATIDVASSTDGVQDDDSSNTITSTSQSLADSTEPFVESAKTADANDDGKVDEIVVTLSEPVDDSAVDTSSFASLSSGSLDSVGTGSTADDSTLVLAVSGISDTSTTPTFDLVSGNVPDLSDRARGNDQTGISTSDKANAVLLTVEKSSSSEVKLTFSESVRDTDNSNFEGDGAGTPDFSYTDNNGEGATALSGNGGSNAISTGSTIKLSTDNSINSDDINTDEIKVENVEDSAGNEGLGGGSSMKIDNPSGFNLAGDTNGDVSTEVEVSGTSQATQALIAGQEQQDVGLIRIKDVSGGDSPITQRTILTMPSGITINESASSLLVSTTSGGVSVDSAKIKNSGSTLRIEHSGSSQNGEVLRVSGMVVDIANDTSASFSGVERNIAIDYATGSIDSGLMTTHKPKVELKGSVDIGAGSSGKSVSSNVVVDTPSTSKGDVSGMLSKGSNLVVYANESNGVTWDTSVKPSSLSYSGATGKVNSSAVTITSSMITIPVTSDFSEGDTLKITGGLQINATTTASDSLLAADTTPADSTGTVAAEQTSTSNNINVKKPKASFDGSSTTFAVGQNAQGASFTQELKIDSVTSGDLTTGSDGSGDTGWLNVTINRPDVTFDDSVSGPTVVSSTSGKVTDKDNDGFSGDVYYLNNNNKLAVNIELTGSATTSDAITLGGIQLNASDSLSEGAKLNFEVNTTPSAGTVIPITATKDGNPSSSKAPVTFDKPDLQEAQDTIAVGEEREAVSSTELKVTSTVAGDLTVDADDNGEGAGDTGWLNVTINRSDVTFDTSVADDTVVSSTSNTRSTSGDNDFTGDVYYKNNNSAGSRTMAVQFELAGTASNTDSITLGGFQLNSTDNVPDGAVTRIDVTTTPDEGAMVSKDAKDSGSTTITLQNPDTSNSAQTINLDNDGVTGKLLKDVTVTTKVNGDLTIDAITSTKSVDDSGDTGWINMSVNGSGVTFDDRVAGSSVVTSTSGNLADKGNDGFDGNVYYRNSNKKIAIHVELTSTPGGSEALTIGGAKLNVSSGVPGGTKYRLKVKTSPAENKRVSQDLSNLLTVKSVNPTTVYGDADTSADSAGDDKGPNSDYGTAGSAEATTTVNVGNSATSSVYVEDGGSAYGDADLTLSLVKQPSGASQSVSSLLNTSSLTTRSDGTAGFKFSAPSNAVTGDYIINASTSSGGVNITYTVSAGTVKQLNVTQVKDALAGDGNQETEEAIYKVVLEDSAGNRVTDKSIKFSTIIGGDAQRGDNSNGGTFYENYKVSDGTIQAANGNAFSNEGNSLVTYDASSDDKGNAGEFYIALRDSTEESVQLEVRPDSSGISGDTATATFFTIRNVEVSLNATTVTALRDDQVEARIKSTDGNGNTVTVPRLTPTVNSGNTTVATVSGSTSPSTNNSGVATTTVDPKADGSAAIEGLLNNKLGSTTLTVSTPPYGLANIDLSPSMVDSDAKKTHTLNYTVEAASQDGNSDTHRVTFPSTVTLSNVNIKSVTDADGETIQVSSGPNLAGVNGGTGNQIVFGIQPDNNRDTGQIDVKMNFTADFPSVSSNVTENVTVKAEDSSKGTVSKNTSVTINAPQPNFDVQNLNPTSATVKTGEKFNVSAVINNTGNGQGNQTVELRFEPNGPAQMTKQVKLDAGNQTTVNFTGVTVSNAGTYNHTIASADDKESGDLTVNAPANYQVSNLNPTDTTVNKGEKFNVSATIQNTGDLMGNQTVELRFEPNGPAQMTKQVKLGAGNQTTVKFVNVTVQNTGTYNHTVATNDDSVSGNLTVQSAAQADFNLSNIQVVNEYEGRSGAAIPDGQAVQKENITVKAKLTNTGSGAGSTDVTFNFGGGTLTKTISVSSLSAGSSTMVYVDIQLGTDLSAGTYNHEFTVVGGDANSNASATLELFEAGDVNHDGSVNSGDGTLIQQAIVGQSLQTYNPGAADLTEDGSVNSGDVTRLQQIIVGSFSPPSLQTKLLGSGTK